MVSTLMPLAIVILLRWTLSPNRIASIWLGLRSNPFARNQWETSSTHNDTDLRTCHHLVERPCIAVYHQHIDDNADCELRPRCRLVRCTWRTAMDRAHCRGMPDVQLTGEDCSVPTVTFCCWSEMKDCSQMIAEPRMPKSWVMRSWCVLWLTVSSAAEMSSGRRTVVGRCRRNNVIRSLQQCCFSQMSGSVWRLKLANAKVACQRHEASSAKVPASPVPSTSCWSSCLVCSLPCLSDPVQVSLTREWLDLASVMMEIRRRWKTCLPVWWCLVPCHQR